eukprot:gb/GEZJ01001415.1/.p1 GENE.gb/GEZJ01001415.1/~~gb/GEZJ01001415.1/.p1  ORF type:complete len:229 (+),score=20.21 gb/GEZJ01001415.1/:1532-2218(+)
MNRFIIFCFVLRITLSAAASLLRQKCVTDADGKMNCFTMSSISSTIRASSCSQSDILCWNKEALNLVNDVRRRKGKSALILGPQSQLDNAMRYASKLASEHTLYHQQLKSVTKEVGCGRWIGGENLAYNYDQRNAAASCVDQWINSQGHFENLVRNRFEQVVLGLHFKNDGSVFCVQTFSSISKAAPGGVNDQGCGPISGSASVQSKSSSPSTNTQGIPGTSVWWWNQ